MDLNRDIESPMRRTSLWGFVGILENGKAVGIGTYSSYRDGAAHANSWLHATPGAHSWEGQVLYEEIQEDD